MSRRTTTEWGNDNDSYGPLAVPPVSALPREPTCYLRGLRANQKTPQSDHVWHIRVPPVSDRELHPEMPTPAERKALVFLSAVIVLGGATRIYRSYSDRPSPDPKSTAALERQIRAVDSAIGGRHSGSKRKKKGARKGAPADPPSVPSTIDLDVASADQIETLRGIGPLMAVRIVADRDSLGPFGSIDGFQRVKGIGPALAGKLAGNVTFSGVPRPVNTVVSRRSVKKDPKRKSRRREEVY